MKKIITILGCILIYFGLSSCGNIFKYEGVNYRTNARSEADLGSLGHQNFNLFIPNSYKKWGEYKIKDVPVQIKQESTLSSMTENEILLMLKKSGIGEAEAINKAKNISEGKYRLVSLLQQDMLKIVNRKNTQDEKDLHFQLSKTKRPRIVTAVIIAYNHSVKTERALSGNVKLSVDDDGNVKLSSSQKSAITLEPGSIVACLLYTSPSPRDQRGSRMPSSA